MKKKYIPLIVAVSLPIFFVLVLALTLLLPSLAIKPTHDFVYTSWNQYNEYYDPDFYGIVRFENRYEVENGKLVKVAIPKNQTDVKDVVRYVDAPKLYRYDIDQQAVREISFEEAQALSFNLGPASPEGYTIKYEYGSSGIFELFGSDPDAGYVISKGSAQKKLEGIETDRYSGAYDFRLIGWIN